jgi:TIR domain
MPGIFISYRRKDAGGYAGRLHQDLARRYGREAVFMDIDSISGGVDFKQRIHEALNGSDIALVLIGEAWAAPSSPGLEHETKRRLDDEDDLVRREVAAALKHQAVTVVPILIEEAEFPPGLPGDISSLPGLQTCRLRNSDWKTDLRRICRAVNDTGDESGPARALRRLREVPGRVAVGAIAAIAALAIAAALLFGGDDPDPVGCVNQFIPNSARAGLSDAADSAKPAAEGSVFYGSCGARTWALASFPDGSDGVFVQNGLDWVDLGPIAASKCIQVPREMLQVWKQDDC